MYIHRFVIIQAYFMIITYGLFFFVMLAQKKWLYRNFYTFMDPSTSYWKKPYDKNDVNSENMASFLCTVVEKYMAQSLHIGL